jgi:hypothetical protein
MKTRFIVLFGLASCANSSPKSKPADVVLPPPAVSSAAVTPAPPVMEEAGVTGTVLTTEQTKRSMAMDAPPPKTTWTLRGPKGVIKTGTWTGDYRYLGFAQTSKVHVVLYFDQVGAWYGIRDIGYLDETGEYKENLVDGMFAVSDVMSSDGQFIAFVGTMKDKRPDAFRVLLYDVATKKLRDIAAPPAAPPAEADFCGKGWLDKSGIAFWQPLEDGIISFGDSTLKISYGADTCKARAKSRTVKEFPLR